MAATTRQTNLLVQQDWKKVYESFQNADFESYDFETLRKSMVDYLRTYYPEDFNDFVESSEYIALIDLIAFLGQSLAFRTDLNARENFIDTAERRDSVLKLARLISYFPKRNIPASGLLKIDAVSTTESVYDSNGTNLSNLTINWNDAGNDMWQEQISTILNASFINSQTVGYPGNSQTIAGVTTEEYSVQIGSNTIPAYKFELNIGGTNMLFEIVNPTSVNEQFLYEVDPRPKGVFNMLYRTDNLGNDSVNTGWFVYFKQGELKSFDFNLAENIPNRVVNVNVNSINNTDTWLYKLDSAGAISEKWTQVPAVSGTNVIYNTLTARNLFQVNSRANDQADLVFGDGSFASVPVGTFRFFFRTSNGLTYRITPDEMQNVVIPINYVSRAGRTETLTVRASLHYTVSNATARESQADVRTKAPQQYYTQDRMITGEDYNILPYTKYSTILKIKAVNRSSSGISRYLDTIDVTGKYSSTNIFCQDGIFYRKETIDSVTYVVSATITDLLSSVRTLVNETILASNKQAYRHFVYENLPRYTTTQTDVNLVPFAARWYQLSVGTNQSRGYFTLEYNYNAAIAATVSTGVKTIPQPPLKVGTASSNSFKFITVGSIIKFTAPTGQFFDINNNLISITAARAFGQAGDKTYIYATVTAVQYDGVGATTLTTADAGPITLSILVPAGAVVDTIIPKVYSSVTDDVLTTAVTFIKSKKNFGIRFDQATQKWRIVLAQDLKLSQSQSSILNTDGINAEYGSTYAGSTASAGLDSSWLIAFVDTNLGYKVYYRQLNYIFESELETKFFFDPQVRVYDPKTAQVITDQIRVLSSNIKPDNSGALLYDRPMDIFNMILDPDGYNNPNRILVTFADTNRDGVPDDPDVFSEVVLNSTQTLLSKYVFFEKVTVSNSYQSLVLLPAGTVNIDYGTQGDISNNWQLYNDGQVFYAFNEQRFYILSVSLLDALTVRKLTASEVGTQYLYYVGRRNLYFQYRHASPGNRRIDPTPNNIIDLYIMENDYAAQYRAWVTDTTGKVLEPASPTTDSLSLSYGGLSDYKAMSDTLIFNPGKFKLVFGASADPALRATFKVIKNSNVVISDNEIKSRVISAINTYFDVANWDFGETFYFSELSAYLHQALLTYVSSIIIVPSSSDLSFGNLYQINAEPNEIITSSATVDNVQVINAITAAQLK